MRPQLICEWAVQNKLYTLHDSARPLLTLLTRVKLKAFDGEIFPHPPYSPTLTLTDYHHFRSLINKLREAELEEGSDLESYLANF